MRWLYSIIVGAGMIALMAPSYAHARSWPRTAGWEVIEDATSCAIWQDFEGKGSTELLVVLHVDGTASAALSNTGWSTADNEDYELSWIVNGSTYSGTAFGIGKSYEVRKGFGAKFSGEFIDDIAKGSSLGVYRGDVVVDELSLAGTGAAIAMAKRCLQSIKADMAAAERERQRFAHIADDPFATAATENENAKSVPAFAHPINSGVWVTGSDYPSGALREGREGRASYRVSVGPEGRVKSCEITKSSGHADLDAETCNVVTRRARFAPVSPSAADRVYENIMSWSIPQ